jgi:hypothetical protein
MPDQAETNSARILAPLALAVCTIAVFAVLFTSGGENENTDRGAEEQRAGSKSGKKRRASRRFSGPTYTVKTGDTLAGIARKTGLSTEKLQELNPQLDPQALVSGQKIKLRE